MKTGANKADQAAIYRMRDDGAKAEEISKVLKINIDTVKSFMGHDPVEWEAQQQAAREEAAALQAEQEAVARAAAEAAASATAKK